LARLENKGLVVVVIVGTAGACATEHPCHFGENNQHKNGGDCHDLACEGTIAVDEAPGETPKAALVRIWFRTARGLNLVQFLDLPDVCKVRVRVGVRGVRRPRKSQA